MGAWEQRVSRVERQLASTLRLLAQAAEQVGVECTRTRGKKEGPESAEKTKGKEEEAEEEAEEADKDTDTDIRSSPCSDRTRGP